MTAVKMPQLGETVIEGTILKWLKQEGDQVALDEPLFEISTDKVDTEVPSSVAGTLTKILVSEGETVAVGTELAEINGAEGGADGAAAGGAAAPGTPSQLASEPPADAPAVDAPDVGDEVPSAASPPAFPRPRPRRRLRFRRSHSLPLAWRQWLRRRSGGPGRRSCRRSCGGWRPSIRSTSRRSPERGPVGGSRRTTC